jgi:hypothetical protein
MKVELIQSISVREYNEKLIDEMPFDSVSRRNFLKMFTLGAAGILVPTAFYSENAEANPLVGFFIRMLSVLAGSWAVGEAMSGDIVIGNQTKYEKSDNVKFELVKSEDMSREWVAYEDYSVPPMHRNTYRYTGEGSSCAGNFNLRASCTENSKRVNNIYIS